MGDNWETSANRGGPHRLGDKCETNGRFMGDKGQTNGRQGQMVVEQYAMREWEARQAGSKWETRAEWERSGRQMGERQLMMEQHALEVGDKCETNEG